jgi:Sjoegren syndrome nuclear autoantigen 1
VTQASPRRRRAIEPRHTHTRAERRDGRPTAPERAGIEDLREKREAVNTAILKEEEEKAKIQKDLSILTDRLSKINEALARRVMARNEYDKTIQETEAAYMKILESSQTLLHVLKRETVNLTKKKQYSS